MNSFVKHSVWTISTQGLIFLVGMATSIIIARVLLSEGRGIYAVTAFLPSFLMYLCNFGIGFSTVYYMANGQFKRKTVFGNGLLFTLIHILVALVCGFLVISIFKDKIFPGIYSEYLYLSLMITPGMMMISYLAMVLLGVQRIKDYNVFQFLRPMLLLISVAFFLLVIGLGVRGAILADIVVTYGISFLLLFFIIKKIGAPSLIINKEYIKEAYLYGIKTYIGSLLFFLSDKLNVIFLNLFLNPFSVGIFTLSYGISQKLWLISDSIATNLFPKIASEKDDKKTKELTPIVFKTTLLLIIFIAAVLWIISETLIVSLFSKEFIESVKPFKVLLISVVFYSGWRILEFDLRGRGKINIVMLPMFISLFISISLNVLLIPKYGVMGATWASTIASFITLLSGMLLYVHSSDNKVYDLIMVNEVDIRLYKKTIQQALNMICRIFAKKESIT